MKEKNMTPEKEAMLAHVSRQLAYTKEKCAGAIMGMMAPDLMDCDPTVPSLTLCFHVDDWMRNVGQTMHGGLICTAFDTTFGLLTNYYSRGHYITTTNLAVTYLEPVFPGEDYVITVKANRVGGTLASLYGEAWAVKDERRRLADTATASFMILKERFIPPWEKEKQQKEPAEG